MKKQYGIYVASMEDYGNGFARGGWIKLPVSDAKLQEELKRIGIHKKNEIAVLDTDMEYELMHDIHLSDSISDNNTMAKLIELEECNSSHNIKFETVKALCDDGLMSNDIYNVMNVLLNVSMHSIGKASEYGYNNPKHGFIISKKEALGSILFDHVYYDEKVSETIQSFIDYDLVYKTLSDSMNVIEVPIDNDIYLIKYNDFNEIKSYSDIKIMMDHINKLYDDYCQ